MTNNTKTINQNSAITKLTVTAMLAAVAVGLQYLEFPVPLVPSFLKMDLSDIPELIGAFIVGPFGGALIALLKNLIHLPATQTAGVGELANFLLGAVFSLTAGAIYKRNKTKKSAILACFCGTFAMAAVSFPINLWIVYPFYAKLFGGMDTILGLYKTILPASDTLPKSLLIFNIPFTLVKGVLCSVVTILVYKPLSNLIKQMNKQINGKRKPAA